MINERVQGGIADTLTYKGTRRMKLLDSNEIRQLRDVCIFEVNGIEIFMLIIEIIILLLVIFQIKHYLYSENVSQVTAFRKV